MSRTMMDFLQVLTPVLVALIGLLSALNRRKIKAMHGSVQQIHIMINSRMDDLLHLTAEAARAAGAKEEAARALAKLDEAKQHDAS